MEPNEWTDIIYQVLLWLLGIGILGLFISFIVITIKEENKKKRGDDDDKKE